MPMILACAPHRCGYFKDICCDRNKIIHGLKLFEFCRYFSIYFWAGVFYDGDMHDKVAVVTGAYGEIGKGIAWSLHDAGAKLALVDIKEVDVREFNQEGFRAKSYYCNILDVEAIRFVLHAVKEEFGRVDYLVNNAGFSSGTSLERLELHQFEYELAINIKGTFQFSSEARHYLADEGAIVNIASIRGRTGTANSSPGYAAAKAAVINMTKSFAYQLAPRLRVNAVAPGFVHPTAMTSHWTEERLEQTIEKNPMKRVGTPMDIGHAVRFLLSEEASYITGHTLDVNGGEWMG
jgi:3-oxoacyl-[acyl-carrier protein] reductase